MKKSTITLSGRTRILLWWPLILTPFVIIFSVLAFVNENISSIATIIFDCIYFIFAISWIVICNRKLNKEIVKLAESYNDIQTRQLDGIEIPIAFFDEEGYFIWENESFKKIFIEEGESANEIEEVFPNIKDRLNDKDFELEYNKRIYRVHFNKLNAEEKIYSINLFDVTQRHIDKKEIENLHPVVVKIFIDNYEDVMKSIEPIKRPICRALIEKKINQYFVSAEGSFNVVDKDEYLAHINHKNFEKIKADKFSIVEDIKKINYGNNIAPTISIGIGLGSKSILTNEEYCRDAIELCLARGGDQVVVKDGKETYYFGGKTERANSNSKVRMRIRAQELTTLIASKKKIYIMGHANADADSLGSATGIYVLAKSLGKEAAILFGEPNETMKGLYKMVSEAFPEAFSNREPVFDDDMLLVVVDVNRPSICEFPDAIKKAKCVAIIDHHRKGEDAIKNPDFDYVETYASSTSEMVTEIVEYIFKEKKIDEITASALYAGIVVDTYNFNTKTSARTFEAAAYLKNCGADTTRVRKMLRESIESFKEKIDIVNTVEIFNDYYAFGSYKNEDQTGDPVIGAQAANALLEINGIKASFVFTPVKNKIYISARSIDETNVQIILERMGGGGHLTVAGAQLEGYTLEEAINYTKKTIIEMTAEGEI